MYRSDLSPRDKGGAIAAVIAVHAGLLFALLHLSGTIDFGDQQSVLRVFNLANPPPPPPALNQRQPKPKAKEGGSAPKNVKSEASPVVAPKPRIVTPPVQPIVAAETPRRGTAPTQGASTVAGPGTGAGGAGTGAGRGAGGSGPGGGGNGIVSRPQLLTPSLRAGDYPAEIRRRWPRGPGPMVIFTVLPNGRVTNCRVFQSSGDAEIDNITCSLVTQRFVYRPAYNQRGQAVTSQAAYRQGD
jgi:periplasmic protein TonB